MKRNHSLRWVALAAVVLVAGCGEPSRPPKDNPCGWPDYCDPETAQVMLEAVRGLANAAENQGEIDPALGQRVSLAVDRCLDPLLRNQGGVQVCKVQKPLPCDELREIKAHAEDPTYPVGESGVPATPPRHWETIAEELENFPTGN